MAFIPGTGFVRVQSRPLTCAPTRRSTALDMSLEQEDKVVVKEYFNTKGFDRWSRIYSEDGEINNVQKDIREGHQITIDTILEWLDEDGNLSQQKICDAGCGVGSLAIPLAQRGATVSASDISESMANEGRARADTVLGPDASRVSFEAADLESLAGSYDVVCCIDVLIHYPDEKLGDMIGHLGSLTTGQLIFSFAPRTPLLALLKKVGDFFPGPSKATRAYLHAEDEIVSILSELGFKVIRRSETRAKFYYSTVLQVERA